MDRVPEPELMLDPEQARAYAEADFSEPHDRFVELLCERLSGLPPRGRALDLGCGSGDVTLRLARALPGFEVLGVDGSPAMLALASRAAERAGLAGRVRFEQRLLRGDPRPPTGYELVFSNSLLHHLTDPDVLWSEMAGAVGPDGALFAMDLCRPASPEDAVELVERYAAGEPEVLRRDFLNSLRAAYRADEVRAQLRRAGLDDLLVETVSDRHLIVWRA